MLGLCPDHPGARIREHMELPKHELQGGRRPGAMLWQRTLANPALREKLPELKGKILGCWCAPEACHGDILAELANR